LTHGATAGVDALLLRSAFAWMAARIDRSHISELRSCDV